jgi:HlyD family secretion protein
VENGEAHLREVEVGQRTPLQAEIVSGLDEGAEVIVHPSNQIQDGAAISVNR